MGHVALFLELPVKVRPGCTVLELNSDQDQLQGTP